MKKFERVLEQKRDELERYLRELKNVEAEMVSVRDEIVTVEQKEGKKLKRALDAQIAALLKKVEVGHDATVADVEKARKEEKKAKASTQQAFEKFLESM